MTNPYSAPATTEPPPGRKPRGWWSRFVLLNACLAGLIVLPLGLAHGSVVIRNFWTAVNSTGDPVAMQHFFSIDIPVWLLVVYFFVPNVLLMGKLYIDRPSP